MTAVLLGVVGGVLAVEFTAWVTHGSAWLVARTVSCLPEQLDDSTRERWSEEIEADFAELADRPLAGLMFALRLRLRGARRLAAALALIERLKEEPRDEHPGSAWTTLPRFVPRFVPQIVIASTLTERERVEREKELRHAFGEPDLRVVETYWEARRITDLYVARAQRLYKEGRL